MTFRPAWGGAAGMVLAAACFNALLAKLFVNSGWSISAFVLFLLWCLCLVRVAPRSAVLIAPLLFLWVTEIGSGMLVERGAWLSEARRHGFATGGFSVLAALYIVLSAAMAVLIETVLARTQTMAALRNLSVSAPIAFGVIGLTIASTLYVLALGAMNGFPLLEGIDRLIYRQSITAPLFDTWLSNRPTLAFFAGLIAAGGWRISGVAMIVLLVVVSILFGEKFTSLALMFFAFAVMPGLVQIQKKGRIRLRGIAMGGVLFAVLATPAILLAYGGLERFDKAVIRLTERTALQAQAWFLVEASTNTQDAPDFQALKEDVGSWVQPSSQNARAAGSRFGHFYAMRRVLPGAVYNDFFNNNVGFIFLLFPYLLLTGGGTLIILGGLATAAMTAATVALSAAAAARGDYLSLLIALKLFVWQLSGFMLGYLWYFFGIKSLFLGAALAASWTIHRYRTLPETPVKSHLV